MAQLDLFAVFVAGLLTFASPCVLPLASVYLSVLAGASVAEVQSGRRRGVITAAIAFAAGLTVVFVALGLAASAFGNLVLAHRETLLQLGGLLVFVFGLKFLGVLNVPWLERDVRPALTRLRTSSSTVGAFVFGAAFGLGWTPCIGPVLGAVLTYTASASTSTAEGAGYLATYAAGLSLPLILLAAVPSLLRLQKRLLPFLRSIERATGVFLVLAGVLLITDQLDLVTPAASPVPLAAEAPTGTGGGNGKAGPPTVVAPVRGETAGAAAGAALPASGGACEAQGTSGGCSLPEGETTTSDNAALPGVTPEGTSATAGGTKMIEFISRSCPICQRMVPSLIAAERDCSGHGVEILRVDVGSHDGLELARRLRIRGVPTFVFLDESGAEVARLVGEQPLASLVQSLEVLSGSQCKGFRELPEPTAPAPLPQPTAPAPPADSTPHD